MKSKRKRAPRRTIKTAPKPAIEKCWYCDVNADTSAGAEFVLSKSEDQFEYFSSDAEDQKFIYMQVKIPRCIECRAAHAKADNFDTSMFLYVIIGIGLLGFCIGMYYDAKTSWKTQLAVGIVVGGAVIGIVLAASRNFFAIPNYIKQLSDVEDHSEIRQLKQKGWIIKK